MRRNVPAEKEEEGSIAEAVFLAGRSRIAEPASTGTEVALNDGMHFEQDSKIFKKVSITVRRNHGLECQSINESEKGTCRKMPFDEHRASERFNYETPVSIEDCRTGRYYDGSVYNYSLGGMYVELDTFLQPGSEIRIVTEKAQNSSLPECCQAKIIWCREITGAVVLYNYGAGVQYDLAGKAVDCRKNFKVIEGGASENKL